MRSQNTLFLWKVLIKWHRSLLPGTETHMTQRQTLSFALTKSIIRCYILGFKARLMLISPKGWEIEQCEQLAKMPTKKKYTDPYNTTTDNETFSTDSTNAVMNPLQSLTRRLLCSLTSLTCTLGNDCISSFIFSNTSHGQLTQFIQDHRSFPQMN